MASLRLAGAALPPSGLIDRFIEPMRKVALTWATVARAGYPVEITSWWRDPARNAATHGASYSQHLVGTAIDARVPGMTRAQLLPIVQRAALRFGATVPTAASESSGSSVHVQGLPVGMVKSILQREPNLVVTASAQYGPPQFVG